VYVDVETQRQYETVLNQLAHALPVEAGMVRDAYGEELSNSRNRCP
jgi:hypothetical protein